MIIYCRCTVLFENELLEIQIIQELLTLTSDQVMIDIFLSVTLSKL